MDTRGNRMQTA